MGAFGKCYKTIQHSYDKSNTTCTITASTDFARTGSKSMKVFLSAPSRGSGANARCQPTVNAPNITQGADTWYGFSYYIAKITPSMIANNGTNFFDTEGFRQHENVKCTGNGPGMALISQKGTSPTGIAFNAGVNLTGCVGAFDIGGRAVSPLVIGQWMDVVFHVKWSAGSDGMFDSWNRIYNPANPASATTPLTQTGTYRGATMQASSLTIERRDGIYEGHSVSEDRSVYVDNIRAGSSSTAVDPSL
jgi:hypothetical protein